MTSETIEPGYIRARKRHWEALKKLCGKAQDKSGLALWRVLHRLELRATDITTKLCNGDIDQTVADAELEKITHSVRLVIGSTKGFFVNRDSRGYALKMEDGTFPVGLHTDLGGYGILAPEIDES